MKIVGGVGYILSLIPLVNIVAPILIAIAWIQMGGRTKQNLFRATGILMLVTFILGAVLIISIFATLSNLIANPLIVLSVESLEELLPQIIGNLAIFVLMVLGVAALSITSFILELASHFRAGNIFNLRWFAAAAWLRIVLIIITILSIGATIVLSIQSIPPEPTAPMLPGYLLTLLIPVIVLSILAIVFSAVAFFKLPESPTPPTQPN